MSNLPKIGSKNSWTPIALRFLETVAMDLNFFDKKIILNEIDFRAQLSAYTIKNRNPTTVIEAILKTLISVDGTSNKFICKLAKVVANFQMKNC